MAAPPQPFNAGRPWSPEDIETLRRLAGEGVTPDLIAERLGRSREALVDRATRIGAKLQENRTAQRAEVRLPGSGSRMGRVGVSWTIGDVSAPRPYVRVHREGRPSMPWTWEIRWEGEHGLWRRALRGYPSAEEAWEAGRAALSRLLAPLALR
jgi:hypothetical protein